MYFKCYTDGSFGDSGETHGGLVFYKDNEVSSSLHVFSRLPDMTSMRNVGGEIIAAWCAITSVVETVKRENEKGMEYHTLDLVYDYKGVGCWATGEWKTNKKATQWFVKSVREMLATVPNLKVNFIWVKGHGANEGNNLADKIADYNMTYCKQKGIAVCCVDELIMK